jgi:hypothetical protein
VSSDKQQCHRLGNSARTPTDAQWSLLDQTDPARGVALTYLNGEKCSGTNLARQLTLRFECASSSSSTGNVFTEPVRETKTCQYELNVASVFGCPRGILVSQHLFHQFANVVCVVVQSVRWAAIDNYVLLMVSVPLTMIKVFRVASATLDFSAPIARLPSMILTRRRLTIPIKSVLVSV